MKLNRPTLGKSSQNCLIKVEDIGNMEEFKTLGNKRNLAEELYRRIGPFDFDKNEARSLEFNKKEKVNSLQHS